MVQGVYILEKDRQEQREGPNALALPWWTFFHFQLHHTLIDDVDHSIFGAIYEFKPPSSICNDTLHRSPRYVIAFRGTIKEPDTLIRDFHLDFEYCRNGLHRTSRPKIAIEAVRNMVDIVGGSKIWLAGHSLGSGIALLGGKAMAKKDIFIESFLFNPPFPSAPIERIKNKKWKERLRVAGSMFTAGLAVATMDIKKLSFDSFTALSAWVPCLFVNPCDKICLEYVGYFEHRGKMEDIGAGIIEQIATQTSLVSLMMNVFGKEPEDSEPLHLIPSATLTVNYNPTGNFKEDHEIHQWWKPDLHLKSELYKYQ